MITKFDHNHIEDVSTSQINAWKKAFENILSKNQLENLSQKQFVDNWKLILNQKNRQNFVWLNQDNKAIAFISFGKPKEETENADFEIYGIYVEPKYWKRKIGYKLMNYAIELTQQYSASNKIILWTMLKNEKSNHFYTKYGFTKTGKTRTSKRNEEHFEEIQYKFYSLNLSKT